MAVEHDGSSLLILAGAGSGKTRVITTKIAYLIQKKHVDPASILAVTFTKKAANEMRERAIQLEPKAEYAQLRTFHSWGAYFLRRYYSQAGVDKNFTVYDDDDMVTLVTKAVPSLTKKDAAMVAHKISLAKDYGLTPESGDFSAIDADEDFESYYDSYQRLLRETGNVDFGDLILLPSLVLKNNASIRHEIHLRYRVVMVDEYQDSNVAQFLLLQQLAGVEDDAGVYVCVVGDDDQSIYKFRGAEIQNILNFQHLFPGTQIVRLESNYRSTSEILACADSVVRNNSGRLGKTLVAERGRGKKPVLVFLPEPVFDSKGFRDEEADFCSALISNAHEKGVPYSDWAILYRTNAQSRGFETQFLHDKIPYQIVGTLKFYEREEIKDSLAWLSFVANPRDQVAFTRIVNKPSRGIGEKAQDRIVKASQGLSVLEGCKHVKLSQKATEGIELFCSLNERLASMLDGKENEEEIIMHLSDLVQEAVKGSGLEDFHMSQDEYVGKQKLANIQELINSASLYPCTREGLLEFLDHIELDRTLENEAEEEGQDKDRVTLITLHNTKGLEFPRVIITGMEYGLFPSERKSGEELEEERRLFYVGITRARDELYMTVSNVRIMYGQKRIMAPSPFLNEIEKGLLKVLGDRPDLFSPGSSSGESDPIAQKWHKGAFVYHDDWGHGQIVGGKFSDEGEYVVTVQFENGGTKKFLPKYQKSLMLEG